MAQTTNFYRGTRTDQWTGGKPNTEVPHSKRIGRFVYADNAQEARDRLSNFWNTKPEVWEISLEAENLPVLEFPGVAKESATKGAAA